MEPKIPEHVIKEVKAHPGFREILRRLEVGREQAHKALLAALREGKDGQYELGCYDTWGRVREVLDKL